jgi:ABC-type molybdate transport system substrate-binding protein
MSSSPTAPTRSRRAAIIGALQVLEVPAEINVWSRYGLALLEPAGADAQLYAQFLIGPKGQAVLAVHGFMAP